MPDGKTLEYLLLPRLTAVAEAAWTPDYRRDYSDYLDRLRPQHRMLTNMGYNFAPYVFEAIAFDPKSEKPFVTRLVAPAVSSWRLMTL